MMISLIGNCYKAKSIAEEFEIQKSLEKDSLEDLLKTAVDTNRVIILNKLSFQYVRVADYVKAIERANEANRLSVQLNYKKGEAKSFINLGNIFLANSNLDSAKAFYHKSLELAKNIPNLLIISHCTNNLGEVYRRQANYQKAIYYYYESLKNCELRNDKKGASETLNNIGLLYRTIGKLEKALECYTKALQVSYELNNEYDVSVNLLNIGNLYAAKGEREKSFTLFKQALEIKNRIGDKEGIGNCLISIGNYFLKKQDYTNAMSNYLNALHVSKEIAYKPVISSGLNNIGDVYFKKKQYNKALEYHKQYLTVSHETGNKDEIRNAYFHLAKDYSSINEYEKAFRFHTLYSNLKDSLFNLESNTKIAQVEMQYQSAAKEMQIDNLKKTHLMELQIQRNKQHIISSVLIIAMLLAIVFYYKGRLSKQKNLLLHKRIDFQNRELTTGALLVSKKNQAFQDVKDKLELTLKNKEDFSAGTIKSVVKDIDREIQFDDDWGTFKYHFEQVHPDFFTKLKSIAGDLSITELKLCGYLRANLSTKEIASLTNTTVRSVQQSKYRINQKFPKHQEGTLGNYLMKL